MKYPIVKVERMLDIIEMIRDNKKKNPYNSDCPNINNCRNCKLDAESIVLKNGSYAGAICLPK